MSSCLGLYIENNVIKYAKVAKEHDSLKVEAFGIKFYEKLGETLEQIISETYSYNIPISVNLSEEIYNYFHMFSLLNKNDLKKAVDTEFESYCYDKKINKNAYETRYAISNEINDRDKLKVIHVSTGKSSITKILQKFKDYKVSTITPIGTSITNVVSVKPKEKIVVVNMEENTTITVIINQKIYNVEKIDEGASEILEKIVGKENSYSKAYEICKNSTIYTMEGQDLQDESNEYLDYIMPTLYKIATKVQEHLSSSIIKFDKIYITGMLSVINNIDLYFQEFLKNEKCEILKPYFISENIKLNIKDYIEVNSALSLALQGLGYGIKSMNYKKASILDQLPEWLKLDISMGNQKNKKTKSSKFDFSLKGKIDSTEKWLIRSTASIAMFIILYSVFSIYVDKKIEEKTIETEEVSKFTDSQITLANNDISLVKEKANKYQDMKTELTNINEKIKNDLSLKNSIPNLLVQISNVIPQDVQITEIENTSANEDRHIVIKAQSRYYDELGYFKAKLKEDRVLNNVVSTQGEKQDEFVKIVIEGDLP